MPHYATDLAPSDKDKSLKKSISKINIFGQSWNFTIIPEKKDPREKIGHPPTMSNFKNLGLKVRKNRKTNLLVRYDKTRENNRSKIVTISFRTRNRGVKPVVYLCHRFITENTSFY